MIDFWATTCKPCIQGLPHMQELYEKYKDQGLEIIAVHWPAKIETVESFLQGKPYTFTFALGAEQVLKDYPIGGIPAHFLIGRDGRVAWALNNEGPTYRYMSAEQYDAEMTSSIEQALAQTSISDGQ